MITFPRIIDYNAGWHAKARAEKLVKLATTPALWSVVAAGVWPAMEHAGAFEGRDYDFVLDAGANIGQFAAFAAWRWPDARLMCFEPLDPALSTLKKTLARCAARRSVVRPVALGNHDGVADIHVATREDSSSLLRLGSRQQELFGMAEARLERIKVQRLDGAIGSETELDGRGLLKIDVQGYEYELLEGASKTLQRLDAVYVEVSFIELYEEQKLAEDVFSLLQAAGFVKTHERANHYEGGLPVQADVLFERR